MVENLNKDKLVYNQEIDLDEVESIPFSEVIEMCMKYINKEITLKELQTWGDKVVFKRYIPLTDKMLLLSRIIYFNTYSDNVEEKMIQLQLYKFFDILLAYTNIEVSESDITIDNYDICNSILGDWLLTISGVDYYKTIELLNDYMNYNNVEQILITGENLNNVSLSEYNQTQKDFLTKLGDNPSMLKDMLDIMRYNDSNLQKTNDLINKSILENINHKN